MSGSQTNPVVTGAAYFLAHLPGMVRHGSKPSRDLAHAPELLPDLLGSLRDFEQACAYPPNQAFIGNLRPDALWDVPRPRHSHPLEAANRFGPFGEIMPEHEFLALLKLCDEFSLVLLEEGFVERARGALARHPLIGPDDLERIGHGVPLERVEAALREPDSVALFVDRDRLVGCLVRGHEEDANLVGPILLENLVCKASGMMALRHALALAGSPPADQVDYVFGCGEEATGDRYQRGAGSLAKAMAAQAGCVNATGSDIKAYCCAPVHALTLAGATLQSGLYNHVLVVGGGAQAKLGMKYRGHLKQRMPILEDVAAAIAVVLSPDDGRNPVLRLDTTGRHHVASSSSPQAMAENLVIRPLERHGRRLLDVGKYAVELHDPDVTETAGSGNVPRNNYRIIGSLAVRRGELAASDLDRFEREHGMPGFSPTQGHIASAIPFLGHAREMILQGDISNAMLVAKGSLFLGKMTQLSDGMSVLLERNQGGS